MQKEWQDVRNLLGAESLEANAQEKTECEHVAGDTDNVGSSVSAGASAAACAEACKNLGGSWITWPRGMCGLMSSFSRSQQPLRVSSWQ